MKRKNCWVIAILVLLLCLPLAVWGTPGFAEWEDSTPGGNNIGNNDIVPGDVGTAIYSKDYSIDGPDYIKVYVQHISDYGFYDGAIIGKARKGFFLFNEDNKNVIYFANKQQLCAKVKQQGLNSVKTNITNSIKYSFYSLLALISILTYLLLTKIKNRLSEESIQVLKILGFSGIFFLGVYLLINLWNILFTNMGDFVC